MLQNAEDKESCFFLKQERSGLNVERGEENSGLELGWEPALKS